MNYSRDLGRWSTATLLLIILFIVLIGSSVYGEAFRIVTVSTAGYAFSTANSDLIEYHGRWVTASNRLGKLASFPGSSIEFAVHQTSSVVLDLANLRSVAATRAGVHKSNEVALTPVNTRTARYGPVNVHVAVDDTVQLYRLNGIHGKALIAQGLDIGKIHQIRIRLSHCVHPGTMYLRGILLEKGGILMSASQSGESLVSLTSGEKPPVKATSRPRRRVLEVLTTMSLSAPQSQMQRSDDQHIVSWPDLIERRFASTTMSVLPISNDTCFSHLCRAQNTMAPQVKDVYFRAGLRGTQLHSRLWSPTSTRDEPAALVVMLGLEDIDMYLQKNNGTKHQATQFIEDFSRSYSNLIQTIRRTAYSFSVLHTMQALDYNYDAQIDESYLYNSAPSNIPIFLVMPPVSISGAGARPRYIRTLFLQTLQKVVNDLKWRVGDKMTFIINTSGWLEEKDFDLRGLPDFSLSQSGHVKFAYKLSLQLCHYLPDRHAPRGMPQCPFDNHDEYIGNLYVPETAMIGKLIEEKKVMRIKEMFGMVNQRDKGVSV